MKNIIQKTTRLIILTSFFLKNRLCGKNKVVFDFEESTLECKSCKKNFGYTQFHWRHKEKQLECPSCNEVSEEDNFFCNVCISGQNITKKQYTHIVVYNSCEKQIGYFIFDKELDLKPCFVCNHDIVEDGVVVDELCVLCRGLNN
jgi:hypothetical protein